MDAKTAIDVLKWMRIQADSQLKREIDKIVVYVERLSHEAAIGRAAVEVFEDEMYPCTECRRDGFNEKCLESCEWIKFCRLRVSKEGGE